MCFAPQRHALFRHPNLQKWSEHVVFLTFWLRNVLRATTACTFSTSQLPKVVRPWCVLNILTSKCASRHNGVHFFDISTSKSGPTMVCFMHFDFEMCFAPQRRALFRHLSFQKWSDNGVFYAFWLRNVLRATTACTFSTSQLPKVVRQWCVLCILTSKCASRHNGVHFFDISTSKSGPTLRCFAHFVFCTFWLRNASRHNGVHFFDISTSKSGPTMVCFAHFDFEMCFGALYDFEMCFAPQRRALFRHLSFQKWSDNGVFYAFWLRNVLRATTACNFSSLIWPAGSAPAALASLLFDPPEPQIIGKNTVFRDFPTFSRICIFFLLALSLLLFFLPKVVSTMVPVPCYAFWSVDNVGSSTSTTSVDYIFSSLEILARTGLLSVILRTLLFVYITYSFYYLPSGVLLPWKSGWKNTVGLHAKSFTYQFLGKICIWAFFLLFQILEKLSSWIFLFMEVASSLLCFSSVTYSSWKFENWD